MGKASLKTGRVYLGDHLQKFDFELWPILTKVMKKLYCFLCNELPISQKTSHYTVPVDMHDIYPSPLTPSAGSNIKCLYFANKVSCQYFVPKFRMQTEVKQV